MEGEERRVEERGGGERLKSTDILKITISASAILAGLFGVTYMVFPDAAGFSGGFLIGSIIMACYSAVVAVDVLAAAAKAYGGKQDD